MMNVGYSRNDRYFILEDGGTIVVRYRRIFDMKSHIFM